MPPQVPIPAHDDLRYNFGNIIVPTYIPFDDGSDKNLDHDLHFLDSMSFGEQLKNKVKQETSEKNIPEKPTAKKDNISNEFIQYSWRTKPEDKTVSTTESLPKKTLKDAAIVVPNLKEETVASASNKIAQISNNENGKHFEKYSEKFTSKTQDVAEIGKGVGKYSEMFNSKIRDVTLQPLDETLQALKINSSEKLDGKKDLQGNNANTTSTSNKGYVQELKINTNTSENYLKTPSTPKPKPTSTTTTTNTTLDSPYATLKKFDKIYDLSNAFSDISNTNIFDLSNSLKTKVNNTIDNNVGESYDQINNKTISKIYDLTKDTAENIDSKNQISSIFDSNNLGFDLPLDNNETRLVNSRTNNSFYYHFYHPTADTVEKQGRSNVLSELVGVTSKRLHVSSNKKPYVRPYYYFPVVYP